MVWSTTRAVEEFLAEAGRFLRAEPARNSVVLTVAENLRVRAVATPAVASGTSPGDDQTLLGWWLSGPDPDSVGGAFLHTPQFPVFLTAMSRRAAAGLAAELAASGRAVSGINAEQESAAAFTTAWRRSAGGDAQVHRRMRLFRLGELTPAEPRPAGSPRLAAQPDRDLLITWFDAFAREVDDMAGQDHAAAVDERLSYGGVMVWQAERRPGGRSCRAVLSARPPVTTPDRVRLQRCTDSKIFPG